MANVKKIGIAGCGGIGSHLISVLYDFGVNHKQFDYVKMKIDAYDDDVIDQKNLLHQNFGTRDIGSHKVKVMERKYSIKPVTRFMEVADFDKYDVVFCCVDSMTFRKSLYEYGWANPRFTWIDGRCESRRGFVFNSKIHKLLLERHIDESQERTGCLLAYEKEQNISHTLPVVVAAAMVQLFLNHLRDQQITKEKIFFL